MLYHGDVVARFHKEFGVLPMTLRSLTLPNLDYQKRKGFTLIELIVSISILAVLISLILPAIQSARKSARDLDCRNHLRQLAVASHTYQEQFGVFPTGDEPMRKLLPFVEQQAMFRDMSSVTSVDVSVYLCPDEAFPMVGRGRTNYLANEGSAFQKYPYPSGYNGATKRLPSGKLGTRPSDFVDGLSQTAMWAERKLVPDMRLNLDPIDGLHNPTRYLWYISATHPSASEYDAFVADCLSGRTVITPGMYFTPYDFHQTDYGYNHVVTPNRPGCYNGSTQAEAGARDVGQHAIPTTSYHIGHVNCALADASVRSVNNQIDSKIWSAVGTRNGREVANFE